MNGGYVSGVIYLNQSQDLYVYVGEVGKLSTQSFNGNVKQNLSSQTGGGATDIRLKKSDVWSDFEYLKSRIMVAAGAGSGERICGGDGGGLVGISSTAVYKTNVTTGGTQISGGLYGCQTFSPYACGVSGRFGIGGSGAFLPDTGPNGGGGYYGGGGIAYAGSASGGSSFVSGYEGCDAIAENSTEDNIIHTGKSIHYSGLYFYDIVIANGREEMPSPISSGSMFGQSSNGCAIITYLDYNLICSCIINSHFNIQLITPFISMIIS